MSKLTEENLTIKSITLLDGVTPDEEVQYKVGREVFMLSIRGIGYPCFVNYDEERSWSTFPLTHININEKEVVLMDEQSIYTFTKQEVEA